ncbi:MAG TPA: hypothetical protein PLP33_25960 [Leptospiraceae bacterium]|nr:hypothetical protein [Leptospiraceae bacterium]
MTKFTKNDFILWLNSKSPRTKVGYTEAGKTPLDRYMRERGFKPTVVMPKWALELNDKISQRGTKSVSALAVRNLI